MPNESIFSLNSIANWLEIIGFVISVITVLKVFVLDKQLDTLATRHLFQVRVGDHLAELKTTSGKIASLLGDFKTNSKEIRIEISKCLANCNSLRKKLHYSEQSTLNLLTKESKRIVNNHFDSKRSLKWWHELRGRKSLTQKDIDVYYLNLARLINELEHLEKDDKNTIK